MQSSRLESDLKTRRTKRFTGRFGLEESSVHAWAGVSTVSASRLLIQASTSEESRYMRTSVHTLLMSTLFSSELSSMIQLLKMGKDACKIHFVAAQATEAWFLRDRSCLSSHTSMSTVGWSGNVSICSSHTLSSACALPETRASIMCLTAMRKWFSIPSQLLNQVLYVRARVVLVPRMIYPHRAGHSLELRHLRINTLNTYILLLSVMSSSLPTFLAVHLPQSSYFMVVMRLIRTGILLYTFQGKLYIN